MLKDLKEKIERVSGSAIMIEKHFDSISELVEKTKTMEHTIMDAMSEQNEKVMITDFFVSGVKRGWNIAIGSMLPNVLMAFVLIYFLKLTGILDLLGSVCAPMMRIFGLPGEALMVLLASWLSMGGGVGVAYSMFAAGTISIHKFAVLAPAM